MWIEQVDCTALRVFLRYCGVPVLVSKVDGSIVWANEEFCEWSGYTIGELQKMGWKQLSVQDGNLEADLDQAAQLNTYRLSYSVQKQYIPKNSQPAWGTLHVIRYPATGPIEFCVCAWQPLKNGTQAAFNMAMTELSKLANQMDACKVELQKLTTTGEEEKLVGSVVAMLRKYPKVAWTIFVVMLTLFGFNNLLQIASGLNLVPAPPVKVEQVGVQP